MVVKFAVNVIISSDVLQNLLASLRVGLWFKLDTSLRKIIMARMRSDNRTKQQNV